MLIIGDLSGIQDYLFDVASEGGRQARRLRARSFYIQLVAECLALRILKAAGCVKEQLLFCGAGKFIIEARVLSVEQRQALQAEADEMTRWLLKKTNAQLRFSLAINDRGDSPQLLYENTIQLLQQEKLQSWASVATRLGQWETSELLLESISPPCDLCRRRKGIVSDTDIDTGQIKTICSRCNDDRQLGGLIPETQWIALSEAEHSNVSSSSFILPGWNVSLTKGRPAFNDGPLLHLTTQSKDIHTNDSQIFSRALIRHIPRDPDDNRTATDFQTIAEQSQGDQLLAVFKADVDSLGNFIDDLLAPAQDFKPLSQFSREMDSFFGVTLNNEMGKPDWNWIYTIFAGGDDLLLVGPWQVMFNFAERVNSLFRQQFGSRGLTISAGITLIKPKRSIKHAVEKAEELLRIAKSQSAFNANVAKDQVAAFGQVWKWQHHATILASAKKLAQWVDDGIAERGWLHTLLRLGEWRMQGGLSGAMATSRLAYLVARNYPRKDDKDSRKRELRHWADQLITDFDTGKNVETLYLPSIVRYAITATRSTKTED